MIGVPINTSSLTRLDHRPSLKPVAPPPMSSALQKDLSEAL